VYVLSHDQATLCPENRDQCFLEYLPQNYGDSDEMWYRFLNKLA